jgi:hypothetical protein
MDKFEPKSLDVIDEKDVNYQYGLIAQDYGRNTRFR